MKRFLFGTLLLGSLLHAVTLEALIEGALRDNPSLHSINERIAANREDVNLASQFADPQVSLRINDINLNDPFDRTVEPMQTTAVDVKQKLPYFGKRDAQKRVVQAEEAVLQEKLENARSSLVHAIKTQAYTVWELERLYAVICEYEDLTRQNIELFESYTTTAGDRHMGIMSAELTLSSLQIRKSRLQSMIDRAYAKLSYLAARPVGSLDVDLAIGEMPGIAALQEGLKHSDALALRNAEVEKERQAYERVKLERYPDTTVQAGYYYRASFDDYVSVGVGFSLPIYGSEDFKEERARRMMLAKESEKSDTVLAVNAQFRNAYADMKNAYETYRIIVDTSLPKVEHMFDLSNASIRAGGDLFKYIDILEQKLKLDQQRIAALAAYHRSRAEIGRLTGETK